MNSLLGTQSTGLLEKITAFGERRHAALAGNIANIQTPGYRMRDLPVADFQKALQKAVADLKSIANTGGDNSPFGDDAPTTVRNPFSRFTNQMFQAKAASPENLTFQDANNRSVEHQMSQLIQNTMMQSFAMEVMRFQFNSLQAVISEQP